MGKNKNKKRQATYQLGIEFIKLQVAGNIPFWATYAINATLDKGLHVDAFQSLLVATVLANALFFVVNDRWVFNKRSHKRQTTTEIWRFLIFMSFSALLTFNITWSLHLWFGVSVYIGQFISTALSVAWTFVGLRFWVFAPTKNAKSKRAVRGRRELRKA